MKLYFSTFTELNLNFYKITEFLIHPTSLQWG